MHVIIPTTRFQESVGDYTLLSLARLIRDWLVSESNSNLTVANRPVEDSFADQFERRIVFGYREIRTTTTIKRRSCSLGVAQPEKLTIRRQHLRKISVTSRNQI